jgi:hypothetical protein
VLTGLPWKSSRVKSGAVVVVKRAMDQKSYFGKRAGGCVSRPALLCFLQTGGLHREA